MATLTVEHQPQALSVSFNESAIIVELIDGRTISVPLTWYPRLSQATTFQLQDWELLGNGEGIHWPQLDDDRRLGSIVTATAHAVHAYWPE